MMEKVDLFELFFCEVLVQYRLLLGELQIQEIVRFVLEKLKVLGKEVCIYDSFKQLLGLVVDGIIINDGKLFIFDKNIEKVLSGNYVYIVMEDYLFYFVIFIQN